TGEQWGDCGFAGHIRERQARCAEYWTFRSAAGRRGTGRSSCPGTASQGQCFRRRFPCTTTTPCFDYQSSGSCDQKTISSKAALRTARGSNECSDGAAQHTAETAKQPR